MVKSEVIKKAITVAKIFYSSSKKSKELVKSVCSEFIKIAEKVLKKAERVIQQKSVQTKEYIQERYKKLTTVGAGIVEQTKKYLEGEKISERIVSYYENHARSLPKWKVGRPIEFGDKLRVDMSGNGYITNWELYQGNPSDVTMLEDAFSKHKSVFKEKFLSAGFDRGFYDEGKIEKYESEYDILLAIPHKKDRTKK